MPITATVDGIRYTLESEDDVVALHRALRRVVSPQGKTSQARTEPVVPASSLGGSVNGKRAEPVRRFFAVLAGSNDGLTPAAIARALNLDSARSIAAYIGTVRQALKSQALDFDLLVGKTRPSRPDANGRREYQYRLTEAGRRYVDETK